MSYILYKTTNRCSGKFYIGVTNGNRDRYKGSGTLLKQAIKIYGCENFVREDLEHFDTAEAAYRREAEIVTKDLVKNRNCYNIKIGGKGGIGQ